MKFNTIEDLKAAAANCNPRKLGKYWFIDVAGHRFMSDSKASAIHDYEAALCGMNQHLFV